MLYIPIFVQFMFSKMYKRIFNLMVLMISVLIVNLLTSYITHRIVHYKTDINPYKFTAIAMFALVFILVPSYRYMSSKIEVLVARFLVSGTNSLGKTLGLLFSFSLVAGVLFLIYLYHWFNINVFDLLSTSTLK